jgi:uncharacterized membrane protein
MTLRIIYVSLCVLVLAGLVHVAIVLLIPVYGTRDAYALLTSQTDVLGFKPIPYGENGPLAESDPFFAYGVCRFDITEQGVAIRGPKIDSFWSATIVDENGSVVYSLNSRTAIDSRLDLLILNPIQILRLREIQPPEIENSIVVESEMKAGFAVLRILRPDDSWADRAKAFLEGISCSAYAPAPAPAPQPSAPATQ